MEDKKSEHMSGNIGNEMLETAGSHGAGYVATKLADLYHNTEDNLMAIFARSADDWYQSLEDKYSLLITSENVMLLKKEYISGCRHAWELLTKDREGKPLGVRKRAPFIN